MRKALLIAYHFPPIRVSSGLQRTIAMTQNLPGYGWQPVVLTAQATAYPKTSSDQLQDIPVGVEVTRAFALDTARHLSIGGRYADFMALPDRWVGWWLGGVASGLRLIRKHRPQVIWSTYPIATAHLIALTLQRLTGLPWVADFRDSMTESDYPREDLRRRVFLWIERKTVQHCTHAVFTTPGAVRMYRERYPHVADAKWLCIPNGYNERIFAEVETEAGGQGHDGAASRPRILLHSGVIYPSERDPVPFFDALQALRQTGVISPERLQVVLRATGHDELFRPMLEQRGLTDIVQLAPSLEYRNALREMLQADGLLLLQAANCNHQIPAKVYEYLRACRPVLALTDRAGDTAAALLAAGIDSIAPLDDAEAIGREMTSFLSALEEGTAPVATNQAIHQASRQFAAERLAAIFDSV
jgi:hypothetical protein